MQPDIWLGQAEAAVEQASSLLPDSSTQLELAASYLAGGPRAELLDSPARDRLAILRQKVKALQAATRYRIALYQGLEQSDSVSVVGYTPAGLERAL